MNGSPTREAHIPDGLRIAAGRLYDAECALHTARQSHLDGWIAAASEKLHDAVTEYLAAIAEQPTGR